MSCILVSFLIIIGGCVRVPIDEACCKLMDTPEVDVQIAAALESQALKEGEYPTENWWTSFNDPQLNQLIQTALKENPTLLVVQARVERAMANSKSKRSRLFPTIGFNADVDWRHFSDNDFFRAFTPLVPSNLTEYELDFDFYYEFDFWGKHRNTYCAAVGQLKAEKAEHDEAILSLTTAVAMTYYRLQSQMMILNLLNEEKRILKKYVSLTKNRETNALDSQDNFLRADEKFLIIERHLIRAQEEVDKQRHMLLRLIGQGPSSDLDLCRAEIGPIQMPAIPCDLSINLLARRPELMAQIWRVEAAAHLVGAAKAEFYPNINLFALGGLDSVFFNKLFKWQSRTGSLQPALHLPIFTAGRIKANLQWHRAEFHEAIEVYNSLLLQAVQDVADQIVSVQAAKGTLVVEEKMLLAKEEQESLAKARYQNALDNLLQLYTRREDVLRQRILYIKSKLLHTLSTIALIKSLGGGYETCEPPLQSGECDG